MATLKANLKRVLEPDSTFAPGVTRVDTFYNFLEPLNNEVIQEATMIIDLTMISFEEAVVSYTGAIRCTNVVSYWDGYALCKTRWAAVEQLGSATNANCQYWPCCAGYQMVFPKLWVADDSTSQVLTPNSVIGGISVPPWGAYGVKYLQLEYGSLNATNPIRIYTTIDMQLYAGNV